MSASKPPIKLLSVRAIRAALENGRLYFHGLRVIHAASRRNDSGKNELVVCVEGYYERPMECVFAVNQDDCEFTEVKK